jgi:hypothetical protein
MQLLVVDNRPVLVVRPLIAEGFISRSAEVDLNRTYTVAAERVIERSVLELHLGLDGSSTRTLDFTVWGLGLDWAAKATGSSLPRLGLQLTGAEVAKQVNTAIHVYGRKLASLRRAAAVLLAENGASDAVTDQGHHLDRLMRPVRIGTHTLSDGSVVEKYTSDDLIALAAVEILLFLRFGTVLRTCAHCGSLFLVDGRSDRLFCRRSAPGAPLGRRCDQVGPQVAFARNLDDLGAAYRRTYKRLDNAARRGRLTRAAVDNWRAHARQLLVRGETERWDVSRYESELASIEPEGELANGRTLRSEGRVGGGRGTGGRITGNGPRPSTGSSTLSAS